jgi:hypothetical protein
LPASLLKVLILFHIRAKMPLLGSFNLVGVVSSTTLLTDVFKALFMGALLHICSRDPGPGCPGRKARDLGLPHDILPNVPRAAVGPCNIPLYNYEQCGNQLRDQFNRGIKIQTSLPANNGKSTIALLITNYARWYIHR